MFHAEVGQVSVELGVLVTLFDRIYPYFTQLLYTFSTPSFTPILHLSTPTSNLHLTYTPFLTSPLAYTYITPTRPIILNLSILELFSIYT